MLLCRDLIIEDLEDQGHDEQKLKKKSDKKLLKKYLKSAAYDDGWFGEMDKAHVEGITDDVVFKISEVKVFVLKDEGDYGFSTQFAPTILEGYDQHATIEGESVLEDLSTGSAEMYFSFDNESFDAVIAHLDTAGFKYVVRDLDDDDAWADF